MHGWLIRSFTRNVRKAGGRRQFALAALVALVAGGIPGTASAECGGFYRVARGDTLRSIAVENLGHEQYRDVYRANRRILRNPSQIEIGQLIYLPCEGEGAAARQAAIEKRGLETDLRDEIGERRARRRLGNRYDAVVADAKTPAPAQTLVETPAAEAPAATPAVPALPDEMLLLTGSGLAPLADRDMPSGGLAAVLVQRALAAGGATGPARLAFVDDWKAHLAILMPTGAFHLGFPFPRPDCANAAEGTLGARLCADYLFSRPLYQIPVDALVRADDGLMAARSAEALAGRTVCRPLGFPPVDLEQIGIDLEIVSARDAVACARMVVAGKADLASMPAPLALGVLADPEFALRLRRAAGLGRAVIVHALAWRRAPHAAATIAALDAGLDDLQRSGEWFTIVSGYMGDYKSRQPTQ